MLALLNLEAGAGSTLSRKAERVAELSRVLRVYPNYARAAHWHSLLVAAGDVPGASAVQAVLPVAEGVEMGGKVSLKEDRFDGWCFRPIMLFPTAPHSTPPWLRTG